MGDIGRCVGHFDFNTANAEHKHRRRVREQLWIVTTITAIAIAIIFSEPCWSCGRASNRSSRCCSSLLSRPMSHHIRPNLLQPPGRLRRRLFPRSREASQRLHLLLAGNAVRLGRGGRRPVEIQHAIIGGGAVGTLLAAGTTTPFVDRAAAIITVCVRRGVWEARQLAIRRR